MNLIQLLIYEAEIYLQVMYEKKYNIIKCFDK